MARVDFNDMINLGGEILEHHKLFEGIELVRLEKYLGMDTSPAWDFKTPMVTGFYRPYIIKGSDKIEKITIGELHYMKRAKYCVLTMTASDDYDLPYFSCEWDETATRIGVTTDFMPVVDIAVHPKYCEKYLSPLADLWRKYRTIPGFTKEGRCLLQRRWERHPWARETLSPFCLDGKVEEKEDRYQVLLATIEYAKVWLDLLKKAEPIKDPDYKQEMLMRKRTMQKYYRDRDPGGEIIQKIFGEGNRTLFVSIII
jgi:hypothetical protein